MGQEFFSEARALLFASNMLPRKLAMGCAKGTLDSHEGVILL